MLLVYCLAFLAFELVSGAKIPPPPPGPSTPVFQDECKDPALNDCPVASVCVDQFYGFTCQCKPGYVDKSPDKDNPGRLCVLATADSTTEAVAQETPEEGTTPAARSTKRHRSKGSKSKPHTEAPKPDVTKSPLDEPAKDSVSQVSPKPKSHRKKNRNNTSTTPAPEEDKPQEKAPEDSESSKAALRDTFTFFDANQDGQIDLNELKVATKALNQTISTDRLRQMLATADRNGDGTVNFAEFRALMKAQPPPQ